jgi:hypothetical protein
LAGRFALTPSALAARSASPSGPRRVGFGLGSTQPLGGLHEAAAPHDFAALAVTLASMLLIAAGLALWGKRIQA